MIIERLILRDFGVYSGIQAMELAPQAGKPVILVGGLNGAGKTTLLEAIQLCLYGARGKLSKKGSRSYKSYLRDAINNEADPAEGAAITLEFSRHFQGRAHSYKVTRSWMVRKEEVQEHLDVALDGSPDSLLAEHWDEYMEQTLPADLAQLFFFDGEQIADLADHECASELLKSAIHILLGLDLVDRLLGDLAVLEKKKRGKSKPKSGRVSSVGALEQEIKELDQLVEKAHTDRSQLANSVGRIQKTVLDLEQQFKLEGGELFLQRVELERERAQLSKALHEAEEGLRELLSGPLPLAAVRPLLNETKSQVEIEVKKKRAKDISVAELERDVLVVDLLRKELTKVQLTAVESALKATRHAAKPSTEVSFIANADESLIDELTLLLERDLHSSMEAAKKLFTEAESLAERLVRVEALLVRTPEAAAIASIQKALTESRSNEQEALAKVTAFDDQIASLQRQRDQKESVFRKEWELTMEEELESEHDSRVVRYSHKSRATLEEFRVRIVKKHASKLEQLILESFQHLARKSGLIGKITINPDSFAVRIWTETGDEIPFDHLSAGERQILATSILWGLAKASGRPLPCIIDTPLGRLDSTHREHLIERYFPYASHQVILLSTNQEIAGPCLDSLKNFTSRNYLLSMDSRTKHARIEQGYFN
jgi:DNA sulfur modification protein DndD